MEYVHNEIDLGNIFIVPNLINLVMCFNEDWMYQFTLANIFCLLELM